ncbi:MAG: hypothetical protein F6K10_08240 [Moorea sp. SIO2B7]|nr:hypothetical protein [Moorena sp. SIO2B7]
MFPTDNLSKPALPIIKWAVNPDLVLEVNNLKFKPPEWGVVVNDSFGGFSLVLITKKQINCHQDCLIKFPRLKPLKAEIVWVKAME